VAATIAVMLMEAIIIAVVIFGEVLTLIVVTIVTIIMTTIKVVAEGITLVVIMGMIILVEVAGSDDGNDNSQYQVQIYFQHHIQMQLCSMCFLSHLARCSFLSQGANL